MDRVLIIVACLFIGGLGGFLYFGDPQASSFTVLKKPSLVNKMLAAEGYSASSLVLVKKRTLAGVENNAVFLSQWQYKVDVGVDFSGFPWKNLQGVGEKLKAEGNTVSGTIPPLKILDANIIDGTVKEEVASAILNFNEEKVLGTAAEERRAGINKCVQEKYLYRQEVVDHAMRTVVLNLSAAIPVDDSGNPLVRFDLHFENEAELASKIANQSQNPAKNCGGLVIVD